MMRKKRRIKELKGGATGIWGRTKLNWQREVLFSSIMWRLDLIFFFFCFDSKLLSVHNRLMRAGMSINVMQKIINKYLLNVDSVKGSTLTSRGNAEMNRFWDQRVLCNQYSFSQAETIALRRYACICIYSYSLLGLIAMYLLISNIFP